jgi:RNA polymerase sigma factor (sigma-70 family)
MSTTQQLVEQYIPFANKLAYKKKKGLPKFVDLEELKSAAYLGLVEAASRYNPDLGIKFTTFSYPRIFGAIHDFLREQGWMRRDEPVQMMSLDVPCTDGEDCTLKDTLEAKEGARTEECFEAITIPLDDRERDVLRHYYIDEYSMKEVGDKFGVSESRISQLIKQYKGRLRDHWAADDCWQELAA